jgi:CIC family chloride channel protein
MPFKEIIQLIAHSNQSNFPVVDGAGELKGILSLTDMRRVMLEKEIHHLVVAKDLATLDVLTITPMDNLDTALKKMTEAEIQELPVVRRKDSQRVISMLSRKDIVRTYHDEMRGIRRGERFIQ